MICGELRHDARHLVASHRNQCDIILIVGVNPLDRVDSRRRSTVTNDVLKHQTITADIREPLAARDDSNAMATFLEVWLHRACPDDACRHIRLSSRMPTGHSRAWHPNFKRIVLVAPFTLLFRTGIQRLRSPPWRTHPERDTYCAHRHIRAAPPAANAPKSARNTSDVPRYDNQTRRRSDGCHQKWRGRANGETARRRERRLNRASMESLSEAEFVAGMRANASWAISCSATCFASEGSRPRST